MYSQASGIIEKLKANRISRPHLCFEEKSMFYLLGKQYPLHLTKRLRLFDHAFMIPDGSDTEKKQAIIALYKELAKLIIVPKVRQFQEICQLFPEKININSAETRWGSCSGKKTLSFSWKLLQCPEETVDYVIVHELAHLKEMNHSRAFWNVVKSIMPDYAARRAALNRFARTLPCWK
jgi:predicted metal-dependent hydrolase